MAIRTKATLILKVFWLHLFFAKKVRAFNIILKNEFH